MRPELDVPFLSTRLQQFQTQGELVSRKVVVVGQGYVGLPIAMRAVDVGYDVVGLEVDKIRLEALESGESYVEDVGSSTLQSALASRRYRATSDCEGMRDFDVVVITVPTPLKETVPDLTFVEESARSIAPWVTPGSTVVLESTTYPGTTEELLVPMLEQGSGLVAGRDFHVGYSPERIDPGNKVHTFVNTPKVVSGVDEDSCRVVSAFYASLVDMVVEVSSPREAELTKLLENTFRHVNVALVNELAVFAHDLGINVWEAIEAASSKPFGFMKFTPGPGVGGHCLPIDPSYLSWQVRRTLGHSFRFVDLANDVNEHMPDYVVQRVTSGLNKQRRAVNGSKILLIGLAYKKDTGDSRESPAMRVAELLHGLGAELTAVDPYVEPHRIPDYITLTELTAEQTAIADAVVLLTEHSGLDYGLVESAPGFVLDTRRRLAGTRESL